jgi:pimeloyl-ACP methyl ester carboxylesterase
MRAKINGINLAYDLTGSGQPVLLIHGYPLSRKLWTPQLEGLADDASLIAPDLRGHGESTSASGPYKMDLLAQDCHDLLDALGVRTPVVLCGLSMGGYVAFAFYRLFRERVAGMILAATRSGADSDQGRASRDAAANQAREGGPESIAASMLPKMMAPQTYKSKPELVEMVREMMAATSLEGILGDLMGMKSRPDSTPTLSKIDVPTLILHGAQDQILPLADAQAMEQGIPDARLEIIPEAGHLLNLEKPNRFNRAVLTYLKANFQPQEPVD